LYQPPEARNIKKALSKQDLKKIFEYQAEENSPEQFARDIFIFSYLGNGMNLNDIFRLKYKNIAGDEIVFIRQKTASRRRIKPIAVSIDEDMQSIIDRYGTKPIEPDKYIFNILIEGLTPEQEIARIKQATKQTNKYLKRIAIKIGIDKNISTYYARHSFASVLKLSGENIAYISESLGHADIKTTENYLSSFDSEKRKESQKKLKAF
jgi:integrase/recombinase XerD